MNKDLKGGNCRFTSHFKGVNLIFRNWIGVPSDCRAMAPRFSLTLVAWLTKSPFTFTTISLPRQTISMVFHWPTGFRNRRSDFDSDVQTCVLLLWVRSTRSR